MPSLSLFVNYQRAFAPPLGNTNRLQGAELTRWLERFVGGLSSGMLEASHVQAGWADDVALGSNAYGSPAAAFLLGSGLSGSVGGTIGGTLVTVTASGGDIATMTALQAAINANTTVNRFVTASQRRAVVGFASVLAGTTVEVCGCVFTAVTNAAAIARAGDFNIDGSDTQDAAAFALAVNRHPQLAGRVVAVSSATNCRLFLVGNEPPRGSDVVKNPSAAAIQMTVPTFELGADVAVIAASPGPIGNFVSLTASGTGMTAATNGSVGFLGNGLGGVTPATTWRGVP